MFTLIVVEIFLLFLTIYGSILIQVQESLSVLNNAVMLGGQMFFPAFIVTLSFYYSNLYDLRIVRSFSELAKRLPRAFGIAFVLLYIFYALFPLTREKSDPLFSCMLLTFAVLSVILPVRLALYRFLKIRSFNDRVLILG